jgi:hypothetical protein
MEARFRFALRDLFRLTLRGALARLAWRCVWPRRLYWLAVGPYFADGCNHNPVAQFNERVFRSRPNVAVDFLVR